MQATDTVVAAQIARFANQHWRSRVTSLIARPPLAPRHDDTGGHKSEGPIKRATKPFARTRLILDGPYFDRLMTEFANVIDQWISKSKLGEQTIAQSYLSYIDSTDPRLR